MNNLKRLTNLNLVWIENHGFWVYKCSSCQQTQFERKEVRMLTLLVLALLIFATLLSLIYLLSFSPQNTICPRCKKKKPFNQHGWQTLCLKCERSENE